MDPMSGQAARQGAGTAVGTSPTAFSRHGLKQVWTAAAPALAICGLWLLMHPYMGVVHDGRLYAVQAFHALRPEIFRHDLFFAFGSQNDYTLFTRIIAPLVHSLGISTTSLVLVALGQALWLSGAMALALRLAGSYRAAMSLLLPVVLLPAQYTGFDVLAFGEPYMTPRLFAEAGVLWALALLVVGRFWTSAGVMVVAASLHPLVAATGMAAGFFFLLQADRRWAWAGIAAITGLIGLALAGVAPFDRLFQTMDSEWLAVVEQRATYLFPTSWPLDDWVQMILHITVWLGAVMLTSGMTRRVLVAVGTAGLLGIATMIIGGDLLHNLFVIQTQPYRTAWLLHLLALMSLGLLVHRMWRNRTNAEPITALFLLAWLIGHTVTPWFGAAMGLLATLVAICQERRAFPPISRGLQLAVLAICTIFVLGLFGIRVVMTVQRLMSPLAEAGAATAHLTIIDVAAFAMVAYGLHRVFPGGMRRVLPGLAAVLLVAGVSLWDKRSPWQHGIEGGFDAAVLQQRIPESAQVYWERDVRAAWMVLHRASYVSLTQGAGIAFSRRAAVEFRDRARSLSPILPREIVDIFHDPGKSIATPPPLTRESLGTACRAAPGLDFVVLSRRVDGVFIAQWRAPAPFRDMNPRLKGVSRATAYDFYLYDCGRLRGATQG